MIKVAVLDDVREDLERARGLAEAFAKAAAVPMSVRAFENPFDLLDYIEKNGGFELYLLDIVMLRLSGLDVAEEIRRREESAEIIFLTSSREYALDAFGVNAAGYLVKPISEKPFAEVFGRALGKIAAAGSSPLYIKVNGGMRKVMTDEIVLIESFNHYRTVKLSNGGEIVTPTTLSEFSEMLRLFRAFDSPHRTYIVNMNYVSGVQGYELIVADTVMPISKSAYRKFKENYIRYCFEK